MEGHLNLGEYEGQKDERSIKRYLGERKRPSCYNGYICLKQYIYGLQFLLVHCTSM